MSLHIHDLERARRARRTLIGAAGVALVGFLAALVLPNLMPANDPVPTYEGRIAAVTVDGGTTPIPAVSATGGIETYQVYGGRNPFVRPLAIPAAPDPADPDDPSDPADPDDPSDPDDPADPADPVNPVNPISGSTVGLLSVYDTAEGTMAQVRVGSTVYEVAEGDSFATYYEVVALALDTGCGSFLYGDTPFELCEGQEILK